MSLWTKFQSLLNGGIDTDVEQQRQTELDATIAAQDQQAVDNGTWTSDQYNAAIDNLVKSDTPDVQAEVNQAYLDGAVEGLQADKNFLTNTLPSGINATLKGIVNSIFKAIPWQVWVIGVIVLFFYLGGLGIIRRQIKNAS